MRSIMEHDEYFYIKKQHIHIFNIKSYIASLKKSVRTFNIYYNAYFFNTDFQVIPRNKGSMLIFLYEFDTSRPRLTCACAREKLEHN